MPPFRRVEPVAARSEGVARVAFRCRRCRWAGSLGVTGLGFMLSGATNPVASAEVRKELEAVTARMVGPDAAESAQLSPCPRCGVRDEVAMAALWRSASWRGLGVVVLGAAGAMCAGSAPWTWAIVSLAAAGLLTVGTVVARLRRADRAVFFAIDAEGNAVTRT